MTTREFLLLCLAAVCVALSMDVRATPLAAAQADGGATITLTDEPCAIAEVSNLPLRATWAQGGQVFEGCFSVHPAGIVILYFAGDKTVAIAPRSAFQRLSGV